MPEEQLSLDEKLKRINKLILEIEDAKSRRDRKIGERDSLLMTLRTQFNLETLEAAKKRVLALDQQIIRRNEKVETMFSELSRKYEI
ncbi:MAG: hypothetical protein ABID54_03120 [Pseudomonadota bacterium]